MRAMLTTFTAHTRKCMVHVCKELDFFCLVCGSFLVEKKRLAFREAFQTTILCGHAECAKTRTLIGRIFEFHFQFRLWSEFVFLYVTIPKLLNHNVCRPRCVRWRAQCRRPLPHNRVTAWFAYSRGHVRSRTFFLLSSLVPFLVVTH